MWLFVMFDLPTMTKKDRKASALFRKQLEKDGFSMHQFSVYIRHCASKESADVHIKRVISTAKQNVLFLKNEMCIFKEKRNVSSGHSFSLSQTLLKSCLRSV